ncbi:hypothetical protein GCM10027419_45360 [Pandoraea terrae]
MGEGAGGTGCDCEEEASRVTFEKHRMSPIFIVGTAAGQMAKAAPNGAWRTRGRQAYRADEGQWCMPAPSRTIREN